MVRLSLLLVLFSPFWLRAQSLNNIRRKSHQTLVFATSAINAEKYIRQNEIPVDLFLHQEPVRVFEADKAETDSLPIGHFVLLTVEDSMIKAELVCHSNLLVYPINNQHRVQVEVTDQQGHPVTDARVFVNNKPAAYNPLAQNYVVRQRKPDDALVKVFAPGDSLFTMLTAQEVRRYSIIRQRWQRFKLTKLYRVADWLPAQIAYLFGPKRQRYNSSYTGARGMIIFNQPKYKLNDTVRLKAYVFNKKNKAWHKNAGVYLEYRNKGARVSRQLATLPPSSPGAFVYEFVLADTLVNDFTYTLLLKDRHGKRLLQNTFRVEDYTPDEITDYRIQSDKDTYYAGDTLRFSATAKDANGLNLLDGTATLVLTVRSVEHFFKDSLQVKDTLFTEEKKLAKEGDTWFTVPASLFPDASFSARAALLFKNSNNELQEKQTEIDYRSHLTEIVARKVADSIQAFYMVDGRPVPAEGIVRIEGAVTHEKAVRFPFRAKIDPFAESYTFYRRVKDSLMETDKVEIPSDYMVTLSRISRNDTLGFVLNNPYHIPVNYSVFRSGTLVAAGRSDSAAIEWKKTIHNKRQAYTVTWQYIWKGREEAHSDNIALLYKLLDIAIETPHTVFPGQKDSIHIEVKDYKGRPAQDVNLTAFSYNSQLKKDTRVPEPPYLQRYRQRAHLLYDKYDRDDAYISRRYSLGRHRGYTSQFGLDTMLYYNILFPRDTLYDITRPVQDLIPQLSIHVVNNGVPQQVYLLYVNNVLSWYCNTTDVQPYVFESMQGYTKIDIRLKNKLIEIDSIYLQPFYKHDLVIDEDKLPARAKVIPLNTWWSKQEKALLEESLFQLDNRYGYGSANPGYVWQGDRVVTLYDKSMEHIIGPFRKNDSLHFFAPGQFDLHFVFEPGYQYRLSPKIYRLEKKKLFPDDKKEYLLFPARPTALQLGDTMADPPLISYADARPVYPFIRIPNNAYQHDRYTILPGCGNLKLAFQRDTAFAYIMLQALTESMKHYIDYYDKDRYNIPHGLYHLLLVMKDLTMIDAGTIEIKPYSTLCVHIKDLPFTTANAFVQQVAAENGASATVTVTPLPEPIITSHLPAYLPGSGGITGKVTDTKGKLPIVGASVSIKATRNAVVTNTNGDFTFKQVQPGRYTIVINYIGYEKKEITIYVPENDQAIVNASLNMSSMELNDVVVVGYGVSRRNYTTASVSVVSGAAIYPPLQALEGRVPGLAIVQADGLPGNSTMIQIRGIASATGSNGPLYVIDGIPYDNLPANVTGDMIESMEVLKDAAASTLYGSRGVNGVVVITTKTKSQRTFFRDYAFWQPQLFTDKNGKATIAVTFPDNITSWQTYVLGMDKHLRAGKAGTLIQAYKPVMAQLSTPGFLTQGDSAQLVGKSTNYTNDLYNTTTRFSVNGRVLQDNNRSLPPLASVITPVSIYAAGTDTLTTSFSLQTTTGFKDGEERKIPVVKRGTAETTGSFWLLQRDTTITVTNDKPVSIELVADSRTLDVLLKELDHLQQYPYSCLEQTASRLDGLLMEKKIRELLHQPFAGDKSIHRLLDKIEKAHLYDGSWPWWENGKGDFYITNYVIRALLPLRSDPVVETNIRNGLLYLQNQLPALNSYPLLEALHTMAVAKHVMDYASYLEKIHFDSLPQHAQWQWIGIQQLAKGNYQEQLRLLVAQRQESMLGGIYWGEENYRWYSNHTATTILAYKVLEQEPAYQYLLPAIRQHFLEEKKNGYWRNTVESAGIVSAILPAALEQDKAFTVPPVVQVSGDTSFTIQHFPFVVSMSNRIRQLRVQKTGGGISFVSVYSRWFNPAPEAVRERFNITAYFEKNKAVQQYIRSGEKVTMVVKVEALKDADYVMLQIPIPAGCLFASKNQDEWGMHKEFFTNKAVFFAEHLSKGVHTFELVLEPRYNGRYTLNPVKAELMYFPVFFGRNGMGTVEINGE